MRNINLLLSVTLAIAIILMGCSATSSRSTLSGNWSASANASMSSMGMTTGMAAPLLNFTFNMSEGPMMPMTINMGATPNASIAVSNLNFMAGGNCFDNMAMATAMVTGAAGGMRTLTLKLSENGNMAMFSMLVPSNNASASGNFALTGGNMMPGSTMACMASASGTAMFNRR